MSSRTLGTGRRGKERTRAASSRMKKKAAGEASQASQTPVKKGFLSSISALSYFSPNVEVMEEEETEEDTTDTDAAALMPAPILSLEEIRRRVATNIDAGFEEINAKAADEKLRDPDRKLVFNPSMRPEDPEWNEARLLYHAEVGQKTATVLSVLEKFFEEGQMLLIQPPDRDGVILEIQNEATRQYKEALGPDGMFFGTPDNFATKLAMLHFGLPVEPLTMSNILNSGNDIDASDEADPPQGEPSIQRIVYSEKSLEFLDEYNERSHGFPILRRKKNRGDTRKFNSMPLTVPATSNISGYSAPRPIIPTSNSVSMRGGAGPIETTRTSPRKKIKVAERSPTRRSPENLAPNQDDQYRSSVEQRPRSRTRGIKDEQISDPELADASASPSAPTPAIATKPASAAIAAAFPAHPALVPIASWSLGPNNTKNPRFNRDRLLAAKAGVQKIPKFDPWAKEQARLDRLKRESYHTDQYVIEPGKKPEPPIFGGIKELVFGASDAVPNIYSQRLTPTDISQILSENQNLRNKCLDRMTNCPLCDDTFPDYKKEDIRKHFKDHADQIASAGECPLCESSEWLLMTRPQKREHIIIHYGEMDSDTILNFWESFDCPVCDAPLANFQDTQDILRHVAEHSPGVLQYCDRCGLHMDVCEPLELERHRELCLEGPEKRSGDLDLIFCDVCGKDRTDETEKGIISHRRTCIITNKRCCTTCGIDESRLKDSNAHSRRCIPPRGFHKKFCAKCGINLTTLDSQARSFHRQACTEQEPAHVSQEQRLRDIQAEVTENTELRAKLNVQQSTINARAIDVQRRTEDLEIRERAQRAQDGKKSPLEPTDRGICLHAGCAVDLDSLQNDQEIYQHIFNHGKSAQVTAPAVRFGRCRYPGCYTSLDGITDKQRFDHLMDHAKTEAAEQIVTPNVIFGNCLQRGCRENLSKMTDQERYDHILGHAKNEVADTASTARTDYRLGKCPDCEKILDEMTKTELRKHLGEHYTEELVGSETSEPEDDSTSESSSAESPTQSYETVEKDPDIQALIDIIPAWEKSTTAVAEGITRAKKLMDIQVERKGTTHEEEIKNNPLYPKSMITKEMREKIYSEGGTIASDLANGDEDVEPSTKKRAGDEEIGGSKKKKLKRFPGDGDGTYHFQRDEDEEMSSEEVTPDRETAAQKTERQKRNANKGQGDAAYVQVTDESESDEVPPPVPTKKPDRPTTSRRTRASATPAPSAAGSATLAPRTPGRPKKINSKEDVPKMGTKRPKRSPNKKK